MRLLGHIRPIKKEDKLIHRAIKRIIGFTPSNITLYKLAISHSSSVKKKSLESNERLEYLGDAVLSLVVGEYLFMRYPLENEGFLTEMRSKVVKRESLNKVAIKIGINDVLYHETKARSGKRSSIYGNALEALVGAVYLDQGFKKCKQFIIDQLLAPHFDFEGIMNEDINFKSKIIEWVQKEGKKISFDIIQEQQYKHHKIFTAQVTIADKTYGIGSGQSKKKAEQEAARITCEILKLIHKNDISE